MKNNHHSHLIKIDTAKWQCRSCKKEGSIKELSEAQDCTEKVKLPICQECNGTGRVFGSIKCNACHETI